jgi:hypothetical protein
MTLDDLPIYTRDQMRRAVEGHLEDLVVAIANAPPAPRPPRPTPLLVDAIITEILDLVPAGKG